MYRIMKDKKYPERLEVRVDGTFKERLKDAAAKAGRDASDLVREAVTEKIETVEAGLQPQTA